MKTNRDAILNAALTVFSQKGYEGAFLHEIAASLGITKAALYKHFESKEALWNAMIEEAERYYCEHMGSVSAIPNDWDEFRALSLSQIDFTLYDETVKRVRRLLTVEQYRNERISALATKHFITDMEACYARIFAGMMEKGILKCSDPEFLAFQFTAPVTMLIHLCDREPGREAEIRKKIEGYLDQFSQEHADGIERHRQKVRENDF